MKVNNVEIISPSAMTVNIERVGSSVETASGRIVVDTFGYRRVLDCAWSGLYASEMISLLSKFNSSSVSITYTDPELGVNTTKTFIVSDKKVPAYTMVSGREMWSELTITFTEQLGS